MPGPPQPHNAEHNSRADRAIEQRCSLDCLNITVQAVQARALILVCLSSGALLVLLDNENVSVLHVATLVLDEFPLGGILAMSPKLLTCEDLEARFGVLWHHRKQGNKNLGVKVITV